MDRIYLIIVVAAIAVALPVLLIIIVQHEEIKQSLGESLSDLEEQARDNLTRGDMLWLGSIACVIIGAVLARSGQARLESLKSRQERKIANDERRLNAYTDLVDTMTMLAHALIEREKQAGLAVKVSGVGQNASNQRAIEDLRRQAQAHTARALMVTPTRNFHIVYELATMRDTLSNLAMDSGNEGRLVADMRDNLVREARFSLRME